MRKIIPLNFEWKFTPDYDDQYMQPDFDDSCFQTVMLPHSNCILPYNNFNEESFQFISCYRKRVTLTEEDRGKRALLFFEGVMTYAKVFFNGQFICEHKGGYTPFQCDVTKHVRYGKENVLTVMVDSTERPDIPPFGFVIDYLTYGGIYREVRMELVNEISINNLFIRTRNALNDIKLLDMDIFIDYPLGVPGEIEIECELTAAKDTTTKDTAVTGSEDRAEFQTRLFRRNFSLSNGPSQKINLKEEIKDAQLWDIDQPSLYWLKASVIKAGAVVDEYRIRFGFREAVFKKDGFYLNGKRVKLRGLNRHQAFPYVGYAMPKSAQIKDAEILKRDLGLNIVRLSHYPQSRHFLDRCDELGLLVLDEIPGWQHIGDEEWQAVSIQNVEEMIKKDWNRPSIVLWGVRINESQDHPTLYSATNRKARELDDTRQTCGIRNFKGSHFLEDVYTYNDFIHRGNNRALSKPNRIAGKERPYLVTEHNGHMYPTKRFDHEAKRTEHALRHLRVLNHMYGDSRISGAIGWCAFDYNTHKDFGSGDRICYHGVMDMFRIPKEAAAVYASQQDVTPYLEVTSALIIGEHEAAKMDALYIYTNCDFIKLYKNGEYIGTHYPNRKAFSHLPHPPIIVTDFIGNLIEKNEGLSKRDAEAVKEVLYAVVKFGDKSMPLKYILKMGLIMLMTKMPYTRAVDLYSKYIQNWGCKSLIYEFEGYIGTEAVLRIKKGPSTSDILEVKPDTLKLIEGDTYDVSRIVIRHTDEFGHILPYSNEVLSLEVEGPGEIIGPMQFALIGGARAVWVKSLGKSGIIKITIQSERFDEQTLTLQVTKEHCY